MTEKTLNRLAGHSADGGAFEALDAVKRDFSIAWPPRPARHSTLSDPPWKLNVHQAASRPPASMRCGRNSAASKASTRRCAITHLVSNSAPLISHMLSTRLDAASTS